MKTFLERLGAILALAALAGLIALFLIGASGARVSATEVTGTDQNLLVNQANNNTAVGVGSSFMSRCRESAVYIVWGAGTGAGAVTVESAHDPNYSGTWAPLATVTWTAASKQDIVQITGVHRNLRTRISTLVTGGTVSTVLVCN